MEVQLSQQRLPPNMSSRLDQETRSLSYMCFRRVSSLACSVVDFLIDVVRWQFKYDPGPGYGPMTQLGQGDETATTAL